MDTCAICSEIRPLIALVPCSLAVFHENPTGMPNAANLFSLSFRLLVHFRAFRRHAAGLSLDMS